MQTIKRRGLFLLTNLAIIVVINIILFVLQQYFGFRISGGYTGLLVMAFIFGFVGAGINLMISKWMAKRAYNITLVDEQTSAQHPKLALVYRLVQKIAQENDLTMPEVGIYTSASPNAFATGATKNTALVAVSSGLLEGMQADEIEGVIGHEMSHVLNGDMVTMTLLQGVLNTFTIFFARVIASVISRDRDNQLSGMAYFGIVMILDIVLGLLASIVLMRYSRRREFAADAGSAHMFGTQKMISALRRLQTLADHPSKQDQFALMKINGGKVWMRFLHSHPSLEERIAALQ